MAASTPPSPVAATAAASGPAELRRAFQFFDRDGNGGVDLGEFRVALAKFAGLAFEESVLREVFSRVDPDGTGEINFHNFTNLLMANRCVHDASEYQPDRLRCARFPAAAPTLPRLAHTFCSCPHHCRDCFADDYPGALWIPTLIPPTTDQ